MTELAGFAVCKVIQQGVKLMDELSPAAEIIGAINVVVNKDGKLWGENTDGKGLLTSFHNEGVDVRGKNIFILGAGGAARAISVECALAGAKKITIANIFRERGEELVKLLNTRTDAQAEFVFWDHPLTIPVDTDILSNATSIGLYPNVNDKPNINYDSIQSHFVVSDVIFNDPRTLFLGEAKKRGAQTINGLGMLVNQAALNFKIWTGVDAPMVCKYVLSASRSLMFSGSGSFYPPPGAFPCEKWRQKNVTYRLDDRHPARWHSDKRYRKNHCVL